MPVFAVVGAVASAAFSTIGGAISGSLIMGSAFAHFAVSFAGSLALGAAQSLLNKPRDATTAPLVADSTRAQVLRSPIAPRRVIYGESVVSGVLVFAATYGPLVGGAPAPPGYTGGLNNLGMVVALAGHECAELGEIYYNDKTVAELHGQFGVAIGGYTSETRHLGQSDQTYDGTFVAWGLSQWGPSHRLRGITYCVNNLSWSDAKPWTSGIPNVRARIKGQKIHDPRDGVTAWTNNWALCVRDYLVNTDYGRAAQADEIDDATFIAAANVSDEIVALPHYQATATIDATNNAVTIAPAFALETGDRVFFTTTGTLPSPLTIAPYHWIKQGDAVGQLAATRDAANAGTAIDLTDAGTGTHTLHRMMHAAVTADPATDELTFDAEDYAWATGDQVEFTIAPDASLPGGLTNGGIYYWHVTGKKTGRLATSLTNARRFILIDITTAGSGFMQLRRIGQPRFTCNGSFTTDMTPAAIRDRLLSAGAGALTFQGGAYRLFAAAATTPVRTITTADLRGPVRATARRPIRELFNAVRGTYTKPQQGWQPGEFPPIESATYKAEDGGQTLWRDLELPFTTDPHAARRLARIALNAGRQGGVLVLPCKLTVLGLGVRDVVEVTIDQLGYAAKEFMVTDWALTEDLGIDLTLREYADAIFDHDASLEPVTDPAPNTQLPVPTNVAPTGILSVAEELVETRAGAGVASQVTIIWAEASEAFLAGYEVEYRAQGDTDWIKTPRSGDEQATLTDLAAGAYEFRVRVINTLGFASSWSGIFTANVNGLTARPADLTGFALVPLGTTAHLRWDRAADLDVRIGGRIRIRWSPVLTGADWAASIEMPGVFVPGAATESAMPLARGTYLAKAEDSSGNLSLNAATVITTAPEALQHDNIITINEGPGWSGAKSGVVAVDGILKLDGASLMDDWGPVDGLDLWDATGGIVTSGTYNFAATQDLGAVYTVRLAADLRVLVFGALDLIDSRAGMIDDWDNFDGTPIEVVANAVLEFRATDDDPSGSPAWGPWTPFVAADARGRGFQFRLRLATEDSAYNIQVSTCMVTIDLPEQFQAGSVVTSAGADTVITYPWRFWQAPHVGYTIQAAQAGDEVEEVSISATAATVNIRNAGARVARTLRWDATGIGLGA